MGDGRWRWGTEFDVCVRELHLITLNQSQGGMCICRVLGIGAGVSRECFGPLTPGLGLRLVNPPFSRGQALPGYSPDFNADEAIWGWAREQATGNLCLGTKALVQQRVGNFLAGLVSRRDEVRRRCRTVLQSKAEALLRNSLPNSPPQANAHPTLALV